MSVLVLGVIEWAPHFLIATNLHSDLLNDGV
jgi:hypothetical protein